MNRFIVIAAFSVLIGACSDGGDNDVAGPVEPPVDPPPVEPPRLQSFADFSRSVFADLPDAEPRKLDDLQFVQDAEDDNFADLLR